MASTIVIVSRSLSFCRFGNYYIDLARSRCSLSSFCESVCLCLQFVSLSRTAVPLYLFCRTVLFSLISVVVALSHCFPLKEHNWETRHLTIRSDISILNMFLSLVTCAYIFIISCGSLYLLYCIVLPALFRFYKGCKLTNKLERL